jgi:nitrous oxidase accessory protein NosD
VRLFRIVALLALLAVAPSSIEAQNCVVTVQPGQSIQQAINTVSEGALVCVASGTFTENITITKSLSLRGAGSAQTILQGSVRIERDQEIRVALPAGRSRGRALARPCASRARLSSPSTISL